MKRLWIAWAMAALSLAGCGGEFRPASESRWWGTGDERGSGHIDDMLTSWIGASGYELIDSWGEPDDDWREPNGDWVLWYEAVEAQDEYGPGLFEVYMTADSRGRLYDWEYYPWDW